jgi:hypothetical protein
MVRRSSLMNLMDWSTTIIGQQQQWFNLFHDKLLVDNTSTNYMVSTPLKNIIWSDCIIIPTIGENKSHVPNHQPEYIFFMEFPMNFRVESEDLAPRRAFPPPAGAALPSAGVAGVSPGPPWGGGKISNGPFWGVQRWKIYSQWIGLRENLQETIVFTIKYRAFL